MKLTKTEAKLTVGYWMDNDEKIIHVYEEPDYGFINVYTAWKSIIRNYTVYDDGAVSLRILNDDQPCFLRHGRGEEDE